MTLLTNKRENLFDLSNTLSKNITLKDIGKDYNYNTLKFLSPISLSKYVPKKVSNKNCLAVNGAFKMYKYSSSVFKYVSSKPKASSFSLALIKSSCLIFNKSKRK